MASTLKRSWRRAVLVSLVGAGLQAGPPSAWAGGALKITLVRTDGQYGDSTFLVMPNGRTALVDGGADYNSVNQLTAYLDNAVGAGGTIWYMALSHAHADHVSGLESALNRYVTMRFYSSFPENDPDAESISTANYSYFTAILNAEFSTPYTTNANCYEITATASPATTPRVSGAAGPTLLGPGWDVSVDAMVISGEELSANAGPNSNSVGYHVWYGSSTFVSGGDMTSTAEVGVEDAAVTNYGGTGGRLDKNVQLLKLNHHGANTSQSATWLDALQPADPLKRYAYVCTGSTTVFSNFSGTMQTRLIARERVLYRTDLDGNARYATVGDGQFSTVRQYAYPEGGTTAHPNPYGPPDPPGSPAASQVVGVNVNLSWSAPATPGGTTLQYYFIYRSTVAGGGGVAIPFVSGEDPSAANWRSSSAPGAYQRIARIVAPGTTYQDAVGASPPLYHYRVRAVHNYFYESEYSTEFTTDTVVPSSPTAFAVSSAGSDAAGAYLNLAWTANPEGDLWDYRVYRATYAGVPLSSAQVTTQVLFPGTTHRDPGLGNGTTYYYRLTARDTSLNESGGATEVSGTSRDSTAPAAPTGPGLADVLADQGNSLNLSWTANTEGDLKDYRVYRSTNAGVTIGSSWTVHLATIAAPGTTHQAGGLAPGTTGYYRLSARDGVLNESALSTEISAYPVDNLAPAPPSGLVVSDPGTTVLNLSWTASAESDLKDYRVYRSTNAGVTIVSTHVVAAVAAPGTTHQDGGLTAGSRYNYRITARDASLNESGGSAETFGIPGPPAAPAGLAISSVVATGQRLNLTWTANTDGDLKEYRVRRTTFVGVGLADPVVATVAAPGTTHQDGGLGNGATYYYRLAARDTSLNESGLSSEASGVPQDTTPPAPPSGLGAANPGLGLRLNLTWMANPESDLKDYRVYRSTNAGVAVASTWTVHVATVVAPGTTHQDGGLGNGATYYYRLSARDASLNESGLSGETSGMPTDTTPPAVPAGLVAVDSGTTIENLSWTANTEADRKDYGVYRATWAGASPAPTQRVTFIATPGTTYQDAGLTLGARYYYRLTARDVTLNESGGSTEVLAVPGPPAVPTGLGVADVPGDLGGALRLSWAANAEGDLKDYGVYRATWAGASPAPTPARIAAPGTTHQDSGLSNGATYYYRLSARDTVLNESGLSAEASASSFSNAEASPPPSQPPPPPPPPPTVSVSVTIAAAAGGSASLRTALEPGKDTTISGNVLTLASSGVAAGNTIEVKIVNTGGAGGSGGAGRPEGRPLRATQPAVELPFVRTVVDAQGNWSLKTPTLADGTYQIQLRQVQGSLASAWAPDPPFSVNVDAVPDALAVVPAGPNPFRPGAGVSLALGFELAEAAQVSVTIHAEDGALVATLMDGQTLSAGRYTRSPAGSSAMVWDGRSDAGKSAASGVYFCRIKIGDRQFTRKILLIR